MIRPPAELLRRIAFPKMSPKGYVRNDGRTQILFWTRHGFHHLRERLDEVIFGAVKVFESVKEESFEGLQSHIRSWFLVCVCDWRKQELRFDEGKRGDCQFLKHCVRCLSLHLVHRFPSNWHPPSCDEGISTARVAAKGRHCFISPFGHRLTRERVFGGFHGAVNGSGIVCIRSMFFRMGGGCRFRRPNPRSAKSAPRGPAI
ncbi:MAG: hypothetical protein JWM59_1702 [Verrucomicrobiales bacterium]|nr:hypothetical protein [Verrucomicrobiales bacterium]